MSDYLDPSGEPITVGNVTLRTPGLEGDASYHSQPGAGIRGVRPVTEALDNALRSALVQDQEAVEISDAREVPVSPGVRVLPRQRTIELEVDAPSADEGQFVLHTDEAGVISWSFAPPTSSAMRRSARRTYSVRTNLPPSEAMTGTRGLTAILGVKLLRVLVFPMTDKVAGKVGDYFAARWEKHNRPYRVRSFTPDNYLSSGSPLDNESWASLAKGRSLLMIHGTGSRTETGFAGLPRDYVEALTHAYQGRVFAFDHPTISVTPKQNVEWFLSEIPEDIRLELDIVCHSRGGLVARVFSEKQQEVSVGSGAVAVKKVIFVAAPNAGTILTDANYMSDYLDSYTNLLNFFPDTAVMDIIQTVIAVAKQLAVGALKGLDGLESMLPKGKFLQDWLNLGPKADATYFALASNYEPIHPGLALWAQNRLFDSIFKADNDLVVPTDGVFAQNGSAAFPINERYVFAKEAGVPHSGYFANEEARNRIRDWLSGN
jgi:hypothetical protein